MGANSTRGGLLGQCLAPGKELSGHPVKFSHKVAKLAQPLTYRRAWRRMERYLHPIPLDPLFAKIDQARLATLERCYASSSEHYAKYVQVKRWLRLNVMRAQDLKLHRSPPQSILDLGCGGGFFLFVTQHLGHASLGIDIDIFPLFTELVDLFGVERRLWNIRPFEPLPNLGQKFDLITAFSIDFNRDRKRDRWWGPPEWAFFLEDLKQHLNPGGRVFLGLNPKNNGEYYTTELRQFFLDLGSSVERENVAFSPN